MELIVLFIIVLINSAPTLSEVEVNFYLHKPEHPGKLLLTYDNIQSIKFEKDRLYKVLFHGWTNNSSVPWYKDMIEAYNDKGHNVIANEYGNSVSNPLYIPAVLNAVAIGNAIGTLIALLVKKVGIGVNKFHLIGHSLGAHIAGFTGSAVHKLLRKKVGRITGLDPASPFFENVAPSKRLSRDDARFVDVIHTNDFGIGISKAMGHADFFPNGGQLQPSCPEGDISCNHRRALLYFKESIERKQFVAKPCSSYEKYPNKCRKRRSILMGEYADTKKARGRYYLRTNDQAPFGRGRIEL